MKSEKVTVDYKMIEQRIKSLGITKRALAKKIGKSNPDYVADCIYEGRRMTRADAEALCTVLGLDAADVIGQKRNTVGDWKGERMVVVDFGVINKRIEKLGISRAEISEDCGYSSSWLRTSERNGGRIRTRAAIDLCEELGLNLADIIVPEKQPEPVPEPEQPETDGADEAIKLTTPIAIDTADAIVTGLADIVSETVSNQTVDIVEGMDALADAVVQLTGEVKRGQDLLRGCLLRIEKVLDKMEELKN
jgi:transcriptional regulator with XRE-family HTH domain